MWAERAERDMQLALQATRLTAEQIKGMSMEDYARIRGHLLGKDVSKLKKVADEMAADRTCMWCGAMVEGDLEAHEEECGA